MKPRAHCWLVEWRLAPERAWAVSLGQVFATRRAAEIARRAYGRMFSREWRWRVRRYVRADR